MPYLGVKPADEFTSKDLNGEQLILDADADTTITADTDDQIDIRIAGADDFSFKANTFEVQTGSNIDMNGTELILDANGNTSITADTDDQIDIKIAGADDFRFTANNFNILSGSTLTVDSGATITNSGTATNFGGGKLLQVVTAQSTTATVIALNAGGSYAWWTTGLTCAITPNASGNKIYAIFRGDMGGVASAAGTQNTATAIGLAGLDSGSGFAYGTNVGGGAFDVVVPHAYTYVHDLGNASSLWTPSISLHGIFTTTGTSEITYEVYLAPVYGTNAKAAWGDGAASVNAGPGALIIMEIEA